MRNEGGGPRIHSDRPSASILGACLIPCPWNGGLDHINKKELSMHCKDILPQFNDIFSNFRCYIATC